MTLHYFGALQELRGKKFERKEDISPKGWRQIAMFEGKGRRRKPEKEAGETEQEDGAGTAQADLAQVDARQPAGGTEGTPGHMAMAPLPPAAPGSEEAPTSKQRSNVSTQDWLSTPRAPPGLHLPSEELGIIDNYMPAADDRTAKQLLTDQCKNIGMQFPADVAARQRQKAFQTLHDAVAARASS